MKKILALAALAALSGISAHAANPFSDVSTSDWAYQAVVDLSDQGIVEGYPDGTFKGEKNITRYEMAQIIARLMAKEDQLNAEQQATINKLAAEYADELANLGVRVSNLEKKVGRISWAGDARMRFQRNSMREYNRLVRIGLDDNSDLAKPHDKYNGRLRLHVKGEVNDSTYVQGTLTANMRFKDTGWDQFDEDSTHNGSVYAEQLFVNHDFGNHVSVRLGRQPITFGNQGGWLYGDDKGYDGAQISFDLGKVNLTTGFGQLNNAYHSFNETDMFFAKGSADLKVANLDLNYISMQNNEQGTNYEIMGAGLTIPVKDFRVFGEYWKNTTLPDVVADYNSSWNVGIGYGKIDLNRPGSFSVDMAYNNDNAGVSFGGGSGLQTDIFTGYLYSSARIKFWNLMGDVVLQKNMYLHGEYAFNIKDYDFEGMKTDRNDAWTVSLNYKF